MFGYLFFSIIQILEIHRFRAAGQMVTGPLGPLAIHRVKSSRHFLFDATEVVV